jgi:hypothetical protein
MRLIVCIKQVPEVSEIKFNPETNTIVREGVTNVVNPFDRRASRRGDSTARSQRREGCRSLWVRRKLAKRVDCLGAGADRGYTLLTRRSRARTRPRRPGRWRSRFDAKATTSSSAVSTVLTPRPDRSVQLAELLDLPQVTGATVELSEDPGANSRARNRRRFRGDRVRIAGVADRRRAADPAD